MKALVVGLGSMGMRRVRNLQALGVSTIYGYEKDTERARALAEEHGLQHVESLDTLHALSLDVAIISTPPGEHLEAASLCAKAGIPFFTELNLITSEAETIAEVAREHGVVWMPSNTELFDADISELESEIGSDCSGYFLFHLGQNIHDWHPWQKPGEHFIFSPKTNGLREMLRVELPWMLRMFGSVVRVRAQGASVETHSYGIDDVLSVELEFERGMKGFLMLDLLTPDVIKRLDVVSAQAHIIWHERENRIEITRRGKGTISRDLRKKEIRAEYAFHEDAHLAEMKHVIDSVVARTPSLLTYETEKEVLDLIDEIERTSHTHHD